MRAEVIAIGDELTCGQRLDTNSQWLSQRLEELGHQVIFHTTVADDMEANVQAFQSACARSEIVVSTGGLGPTADDLTREALAKVSGAQLVLDAQSLRHIEAIFRLRKREMPERNRIQAMFPEGSRPIPNPHGTAPGVFLKRQGIDGRECHIFALPGVPAEMHEMWEQTVAPELCRLYPLGRVIRRRNIKCYGVGESQLEAMLPDMIRRGRNPLVGITVHEATITLRIVSEGEAAEVCDAAIEDTADSIRSCLGKLVFGESDEELEHAVIRLLTAKKRSLFVVECGTRGLVTRWLASAGDGTSCFLGGIVADPSSILAGRLPGFSVNRLAEQQEPRRVLARIAEAARTSSGADYTLLIGPRDGGSSNRPTSGKVLVVLASPEGTAINEIEDAGHPAIREARAAKSALDVLRHALLKQ